MIPGQRISDEATNWPGPISGQYGRSPSGWRVCTPEGVLLDLAAEDVTEHLDGTISTVDVAEAPTLAAVVVDLQAPAPAPATTWTIERGTWKPQ